MNAKDMKTLGMTLVYAGVTITIFAAILAYGYHTWSDCLEENSFFTCARMLNK